MVIECAVGFVFKMIYVPLKRGTVGKQFFSTSNLDGRGWVCGWTAQTLAKLNISTLLRQLCYQLWKRVPKHALVKELNDTVFPMFEDPVLSTLPV